MLILWPSSELSCRCCLPLILLISLENSLTLHIKCEEILWGDQKFEKNNQICKKEYNIAITWLLCAIANSKLV